MLKRLTLSTLATLTLLAPLTARPALAWHQGGHELVAQIAWDQLTPEMHARLRELIGALPDPHFRQFVIASVWPDVIKRKHYSVGGPDGPAYPADEIHAAWHYEDVPIFQGEPPHPVPHHDENVEQGLPTEIGILSDTGRPMAERAVALSWVIHLVGDVHQPLHCASLYSPAFEPDPDGDKGGNAFKLEGTPAKELHAFWDSVAESFPLDMNNPPKLSRITTEAAQLESEYPESSFGTAGSDLKVADWVHQSNELARTVAYTIPPDSVPDAGYRSRVLKCCHQRIALAGYRLAHILNDRLGACFSMR